MSVNANGPSERERLTIQEKKGDVHRSKVLEGAGRWAPGLTQAEEMSWVGADALGR